MEYCHFRCTLQLPKKTAHIWRATTGFPKKQLVIAWDRLWNRETWQVWNQWWCRKIFSGHILKLDPFKNMQFLHIDHLFSHSLCAIIPSLVSKAALKEAFYNNSGEANTHSADFSTLNDVNFFVFLLPLHCLFTREVILYHVTVLILCSLTWVVVVWWNLHVQFWSKCLGHFVFRCGRCNSNWPSFPPWQCWVLQVKHLLYILHMLRTSTLFRGEKSFQGLVYECLSRVSCKFYFKKKWKIRGVPKPFGQDCRFIFLVLGLPVIK